MNQDLLDFVREGLGCRCPQEILESIRLQPIPLESMGISLGLDVGGRLLVLILDHPKPDALAGDRLSSLLDRGRRLRDERGFHRLRLVLAVPETEAGYWSGLCADLPLPDERSHWHVFPASQLPLVVRSTPESGWASRLQSFD